MAIMVNFALGISQHACAMTSGTLHNAASQPYNFMRYCNVATWPNFPHRLVSLGFVRLRLFQELSWKSATKIRCSHVMQQLS